MTFQIRQATAADVNAIAQLITQRFGESVERLQITNSLPPHITYVATVDECVVGFVDGFTTKSADNSLRFELDLIAVDKIMPDVVQVKR